MSARNLFRSDFIRVVDAAAVKIIAVCPASDEPYLREELSVFDVELVALPALHKRMAERVWSAVTNTLAWRHPGVTRTVTIKWLDRGVRNGHYLSLLPASLASVLFLHKSRKFRRMLEWIDSRAFSHPEFGRLIDDHKPDAVLTTYSFEPDTALIREAKRRNIPTLAMVKSWDNLTSKTRLPVEPDKLLVWSPHMKREAMQYHFVPESKITIVGAPGFDEHFRDRDFGSRQDYMTSIGADPEAKLIVYSPGGVGTVSDAANLRTIATIVNGEELGVPCHVHIRKLPKVRSDFSSIEKELGMTSEESGRVVEGWADRFDQEDEYIESLQRLMYHANVVIHFGSTIAIDAACHDTPSVGFALDRSAPNVHRHDLVRRVFEMDHNRLLVDLGATRVATTRAELVKALRLCLAHPEIDRAPRETIVGQVLWRRDGGSGERLARQVLSMISGLAEPTSVSR
jgi:hypothetical protein